MLDDLFVGDKHYLVKKFGLYRYPYTAELKDFICNRRVELVTPEIEAPEGEGFFGGDTQVVVCRQYSSQLAGVVLLPSGRIFANKNHLAVGPELSAYVNRKRKPTTWA